MKKKILAVYFDFFEVGIDKSVTIARQITDALQEGLNNDKPAITIVSDLVDGEPRINFKVEEVELDDLVDIDSNGNKYIPLLFKDSVKREEE